MKCDACGNDMVWEGPIRGGYMVCWHCRSLDICQALNEPEPDEGGSYESYHFDPAEPGDDYLKELITYGQVLMQVDVRGTPMGEAVRLKLISLDRYMK